MRPVRNLLPRLGWAVIVFGWMAPAGPAGAAELAPGRAGAVDRAVLGELVRQQLVGLAVGVLEGGEIVHLKGYGWADREGRVPVTPATLFRWASVSKPLTAVAALQLAEKGLLDLDADVRTYVPEFPDKGVRITARHLLCHQSGIVHYTNGRVVRTEREYDDPHPFRDVISALDTFKESPLLHPPGEKFSYTTHGYILLSAVVERAGGRRFAEQVAERIAGPLGMSTLRPDYQWEDIPGRAVGYRRLPGRGLARSADRDVSWKLGGGGFISSAKDLAKFAGGLLNGKLVSKETETRMWQRQKLRDGTETRHGLGFVIGRDGAGRLTVEHNGAQEKTRTRMFLLPAQRRGVVVMCNCEFADPTRVTREVIRALNWE
ncbi:MAG TPA: serine hydrolase domain-containing protein [Gemmataceae bacterium]